MAVLSDRDLIKQLGKGILLHPLKLGSIRASRICLTASEYAYSLKFQQRIVVDEEPQTISSNEMRKFFSIAPRDTALVWTDESIHLSNYLCGSIHSRVGLVSKGAGHLGTTVTPSWRGVLCIAIHNFSEEEDLLINVRDPNEPIAYLLVHKLTSKSEITTSIDSAARLDVIKNRPNTSEIHDWFNDKENRWMLSEISLLKKLMQGSESYKHLKKSFFQKLLSYFSNAEYSALWISITAVATVIAAIIGVAALVNRQSDPPRSVPSPMPNIQEVKPAPEKSPK